MPERTLTFVDRNRLNLSWLIKLRGASVVGQLATILGVYFVLEIRVPLAPLLVVVAAQALSNFLLAIGFRDKEKVYEWQLAAIMALDVVFLTLLLFLTGGPSNPFSFLYLVNIALAAVALQARWTWMLVALAVLQVGALPLMEYRELPLGGLAPAEQEAIFQQGRWVALGVTAAFIVHFLMRVTGALALRERELNAAREVTARQEQLTSLAAVAAGAAHELATPLGTIALVAKELERSLQGPEQDSAREDAQLIREQVARCRLILDQMGGGLGRSSEQVVEETSLPNLIRDALSGVRQDPAVYVEVDDESRKSVLRMPPRAVAQALRGLITNAQDASAATNEKVSVRAGIKDGVARFEVEDTGGGMSPEVLARVCEPFFTTKPPGSGMGLGLYLTRAVVESLGGHIQIESEKGKGTRVALELPTSVDLDANREYLDGSRV